jgi:hypothetical protein
MLPGFALVSRTVRLAESETKELSVTLFLQILEQTIVTAAKTGEQDAQDTAMSIWLSRWPD